MSNDYSPIVVLIKCGACKGTGKTVGYPGYGPQGGPDDATYTCWACDGIGARPGQLASGSLGETLHLLGLVTEKWDNSKSLMSPESRAALGEMSQYLAEIRRLRKVGTSGIDQQ